MESKKLTFDQIKDGILSYKANSQNKQAAIVIVRGVFELSPTPQVQSGLSAEEVLKKHYLNYHQDQNDWIDAMEEYAASKVAEKEMEIERLTGLLKHEWASGRFGIDYESEWKQYCEANNITQP